MAKELNVEAELDRLADQYRTADGIAVNLLNRVGASAESALDRLPVPMRQTLAEAVERALSGAMYAAEWSRRIVPNQQPWVYTTLATATGAAGGLGGLPTSLIEIPVTTTMILRAIQEVAAREGFDPTAENVKFDSIRVLSAAGPLDEDDGADLGFFSMRLALNGPMKHQIAAVAQRLLAVLGQKLSLRFVPVLGAVTAAYTNLIYMRYYQNIACVHFGLRRLAIDADIPHDELVRRLRERLNASNRRRSGY